MEPMSVPDSPIRIDVEKGNKTESSGLRMYSVSNLNIHIDYNIYVDILS